MNRTSLIRRAGRALAVAAAALLLAGSLAYAAGWVGEPTKAAATGNAAINLVDNDGDRPLFSLANMRSGQTETACIAVKNESPVPVDVALKAAATGNLGSFLDLKVERGGGASAASGSCAGFSKEADVWSGALASFPAPGQNGIGDSALAAGQTRVYRYTASLRPDNLAQGRSSEVSFAFDGTGEPPVEPQQPPAPAPGGGASASPSPSPSPSGTLTEITSQLLVLIETKPGEVCESYTLENGVVKLHTRLKQRGRAALVIGKVGKKLRLTATVKPRGKKLSLRSWKSVTYKRGRKRIATVKRKPFRAVIKPDALRTGPNRIQMVVKPRRGRSIKANLRVVVNKARFRGRTTCVFRAQGKAGVRRDQKKKTKAVTKR